MFKRVNWSLIFTCFAWLISLAGLVVLLSFINIKKQTVKCTDVKILIPGADNFIEREEIDHILRVDQGVLVGRNLEKINIHQIEQKLQSNPYIAFAKVYVDMDGVLHIEIKQRQPILRILNLTGQDFYIDNTGLKMPISPNFTANVIVATGNIQEVFGTRVDTLRTQMARDLYKTAQYIKLDTLWDNQIEQIAVDEKSDMVLIPRVGDETIILGNADSLDIKMKNLKIFYKHALPQVIARKYRTINIKYTNQVVCEKRDSTAMRKPAKVLSAVDSLRITKKVSDSLIKDVIQKTIDDASVNEEKNEKQMVAAAPKKEVKKEKPKTPEIKSVPIKEKPKVSAVKTDDNKSKSTSSPPAVKPKTVKPDANQKKVAEKKNK